MTRLRFAQKVLLSLALVSLGMTVSLAVEDAGLVAVAQTDIQTGTQTTESAVNAETAQVEEPAATQTAVGQAIAPPEVPTPEPTPFSPPASGIVNLVSDDNVAVGIGHLKPASDTATNEKDATWLQSINLPLYTAPSGDHWGWIYQGWMILPGQPYLAIGRDAGFSMVKVDGDLFTFPILEVREDGWMQMQYTENGSAWIHTSHLNLGDIPLVAESWETHLQAQSSVYFLEAEKAQALRSQPEEATNMLSLVSADSLIEPLDFAGDWMRVRVTRPVSMCKPLTGATTTEGWMRWRDEGERSLIWASAEEDCQAES